MGEHYMGELMWWWRWRFLLNPSVL